MSNSQKPYQLPEPLLGMARFRLGMLFIGQLYATTPRFWETAWLDGDYCLDAPAVFPGGSCQTFECEKEFYIEQSLAYRE